jgi:hypothetical protein
MVFPRRSLFLLQMYQNKSIKIFINYVVIPLLFAWLSFSIYNQIMQQPHLEQSWDGIKASLSSNKIYYIVIAVLLVFVNWGLEAFKWKLLVTPIYPISFFKAYKATLSGVSFSVTMPNRVGEYLGRIMYMPDGSRLKTISATVVGSIAQLLMTILFGIIGLVILKVHLLKAYPQFIIWYQFTLYGLIFTLLLLFLFYFKIHDLFYGLNRWVKSKKYLYLLEALKNFETGFLFKLLVISFLRYIVFMIQYILVFHLFNVDISIGYMICTMSVIFLALAVIPTIALIEVGLRGEISLRIIGVFTANGLGIGLSSVTVWFINLIIPAMLGTIFLLGVKLLNRR